MADAMDIASTSRGHFRNSEDDLDRLTQHDSNTDYGDDDDDDDDDGDRISDGLSDRNSELGATMHSLSISSDGNKRTDLKRMSSTSSSASSKMPLKKVVLWEIFKWILDVERSMKNCLGCLTEVKTTTVLNDMDFLLG